VAEEPHAILARATGSQEPWSEIPFTYISEKDWLILDMDRGGELEIDIMLQPPTTSWAAH
jgi:hypothetical protein